MARDAAAARWAASLFAAAGLLAFVSLPPAADRVDRVGAAAGQRAAPRRAAAIAYGVPLIARGGPAELVASVVVAIPVMVLIAEVTAASIAPASSPSGSRLPGAPPPDCRR
jgi:hypothetical protein